MLDFSSRGWGRVWLWTTLGTCFCVGVALYVGSLNARAMTSGDGLVSLLLPVVIAGPMLFFFATRLRRLADERHMRSVAASIDGLTGVLNRGAFTALVDAHLSELKRLDRLTDGALLVIDVDDLKSVNDSLGHEHGDAALRHIAQTISANVRSSDPIGRIGGEEFAIFLPGTTGEQAVGIAERIRSVVAEADFEPLRGKHRPLSVSVGCALFQHGLSFSELFRIADQQLYAAKQSGRNRISVSPAESLVPLAA